MITAFLLDFLTTIPQSICGTAVVLYIFYILLGEKPAWKNIVLYTAVSLVLSFPLYILFDTVYPLERILILDVQSHEHYSAQPSDPYREMA